MKGSINCNICNVCLSDILCRTKPRQSNTQLGFTVVTFDIALYDLLKFLRDIIAL